MNTAIWVVHTLHMPKKGLGLTCSYVGSPRNIFTWEPWATPDNSYYQCCLWWETWAPWQLAFWKGWRLKSAIRVVSIAYVSNPNKNPGNEGLSELPWLAVFKMCCYKSLLGKSNTVYVTPLRTSGSFCLVSPGSGLMYLFAFAVINYNCEYNNVSEYSEFF